MRPRASDCLVSKYGIVENFKSEQTLINRYKGDNKVTIVPTRLVIPLVAGCLIGGTADLAEGDLFSRV